MDPLAGVALSSQFLNWRNGITWPNNGYRIQVTIRDTRASGPIEVGLLTLLASSARRETLKSLHAEANTNGMMAI